MIKRKFCRGFRGKVSSGGVKIVVWMCMWDAECSFLSVEKRRERLLDDLITVLSILDFGMKIFRSDIRSLR